MGIVGEGVKGVCGVAIVYAEAVLSLTRYECQTVAGFGPKPKVDLFWLIMFRATVLMCSLCVCVCVCVCVECVWSVV